jgi:hypothetical protein
MRRRFNRIRGSKVPRAAFWVPRFNVQVQGLGRHQNLNREPRNLERGTGNLEPGLMLFRSSERAGPPP